jgi:hypothetical protein
VVTVPQLRLVRSLPLLLLLAACVDDPTTVREPEPEPKPVPSVVGVYEFTITGMGTPDMRASVSAVSGPSQSLSPVTTGVVFELISASRMTHGVRGQGGQRYFTGTYRVRNSTGAALTNLTFIPVMTSSSISGTSFTSVKLADNTNADPALVARIVPTGSVVLADDNSLRSTGPDVLQVFEESEVAAFPLPSGYTGIFPFGFTVRNTVTPGSRTLPVAVDANDYTGVLTFAFRHALPASSSGDPNTYSFQMMGVQDTEVRLTESIEEAHDTSAVRQLRDRATTVGATTVTVLAGSSALDAAIPDYPGQRQICSVRTAGSAGSPTAYITEPAGYAEILVLRPGEWVDPCAAYFRSGTPQRPAHGIAFTLTAAAMDLYGNLKTTTVDSVALQSVSGPTVSIGPRAAMVSGTASIAVTYSDYGASVLRAVGRRNRGMQDLTVAGITRNWTGNWNTDWDNGANWDVGVPPGYQDSVYIPAAVLNFPVLAGSVTIGGVNVESGATLTLGAFDLTATQDVLAGVSGGIVSTTGDLVLTGLNKNVRGTLPSMRVTGTYNLTADIDSRARVRLDGGRLRTSRLRLQTTSN